MACKSANLSSGAVAIVRSHPTILRLGAGIDRGVESPRLVRVLGDWRVQSMVVLLRAIASMGSTLLG